ncbi:MAG: nucleotide sugar dehydrogenase [Verrucomicrobia bacterium]|nr:MAG: nucleotide sugar dehydrogenase [Verrucomicrobiota bacterium]
MCIVGLGYVGLPLAIQFARSGGEVIGLDVDRAKVDQVNRGRSYIKHIAAKTISEVLKAKRLTASTDFSRIKKADAVIICVPTPLNKNREPDISFIVETGRKIAPHLQKGALVVLESTTYPGTTDEDLRRVIEENSKLKAGVDFHLAFSPEREDPGNPHSVVATIPKIVGGFTPACLKKTVDLYSIAIKRLVPVSSCRVAEAAKLLENIFRSVNIALVNELKMVYAAMGIDIWEVIEAAKTKPFGFMPFYPGPGLGGHCIPIDPFYLTWKAREYGHNTRFIESPSYLLMSLLADRCAEVEYYDPYVPVIKPTREHPRWAGKKSIKWNRASVRSFDLVLIATNHSSVNYNELADWADCVVDTRNAMASIPPSKAKIWKA